MPRRLVAAWAGTLPLPERDGDWVLVAEELLKDAVDLGHAGYRAYRDERRRARAERRPLPELVEVLEREWAARLPAHDITGLLRELVVTVHTDTGEDGGGPFGWDRAVRGALAGLLRRDLEALGSRLWPESVDLDEVRVLDEAVFLGPVLDMGPLLARARGLGGHRYGWFGRQGAEAGSEGGTVASRRRCALLDQSVLGRGMLRDAASPS
ncbi:hypothetical protein ACF09H_32165 [Streptomyces sp. NPDC014983]|uniref:hypothetical protein n=1 Tax=Streptomyces sp. NPDC014983 TaxID=3364933 RepID=UPI003701C8C7